MNADQEARPADAGTREHKYWWYATSPSAQPLRGVITIRCAPNDPRLLGTAWIRALAEANANGADMRRMVRIAAFPEVAP